MNRIERQLQRPVESKTEPLPDRASIDSVLSDPAHTPEQLLAAFQSSHGKIFEQPAGVREGYTLQEHVAMVLGQFQKYFRGVPFPKNCDQNVFELMLVFHDIGKPQAVAEGDSQRQHAYSVQEIQRVFTELQYPQKTINIVKALVQDDPIGMYLRDWDGGDLMRDTAEKIIAMSEAADMPLKDFWRLLQMYYQVDAGSYTADAGGADSLGHVFAFQPETGHMTYAPSVQDRINQLERFLMTTGRNADVILTDNETISHTTDTYFPEEVIEGRYTHVPEVRSRFPFPKLTTEEFMGYSSVIPEIQYAVPDDADEYRQWRVDQYQAALRGEESMYVLTQQQAQDIERAVVQFGHENSPLLLTALYMMGKELDIEYIHQLESQYKIPLEQAQIAVHVFRLTDYRSQLFDIMKYSDLSSLDSIHQIEVLAENIRKAAEALAEYSVVATHMTRPGAIASIEETGQLIKSSAATDYEGDGVYCGVLGSYQWWADGQATYTLQVPLAYTHPAIIISSNGYPQAMVNILTDSVIVREADQPIRMRGMTQWRMLASADNEIPEWKKDVFKKVLDINDLEVRLDEYGYECLTASTDLPPIVWAELCRSLGIARFVPKQELDRFGIHPHDPIPADSRLQKRDILTSRIAPEIDLRDPNSSYQVRKQDSEMPRPVRIKGLSREDLFE